MGEVDNVFVIKRAHSNLEINKPFLEKAGVCSEHDFKRIIKRGKRLGPHDSGISCADILARAYQDSQDPRRVGAMQKYKLYQELLMQELSRQGAEHPLHNKIPLFVNGMCAGQGFDPYSNLHSFSTLFIQTLENGLKTGSEKKPFPIEFLDLFRLIYVQPVAYIQKPVLSEQKGYGLEDILSMRVEQEINPGLRAKNKTGFGTLEKYDDTTRKTANSHYSPELLSSKATDRIILQEHRLLKNDIMSKGEGDIDAFREYRSFEAFVNTQVMAVKFAYILDSMTPHVSKILKKYSLRGLPLYMEKTSDSTRVLMDAAKYYSEKSLPLKFIGGEGGILENAKEKMPLHGIAHPSAMAKLFGFITNLYCQYSGKEGEKVSVSIPRPEEDRRIKKEEPRRLPFFLLEEGTKYEHPNLHDVVEKCLSSQEIGYVKEFAERNNLGFSRIEPRIVMLLTNNNRVCCGFRSVSKENLAWNNEKKDKQVMTADQVKGAGGRSVLETNAVVQGFRGKADFRASEFANATTPRVTEEWLNTDLSQRYLGCSLEKIINVLMQEEKAPLLREQFRYEPKEDVDKILMMSDENLISIPSIIGTAVHKVTSEPMKGLCHYKTLRRAGMEPTPSDKYTETSFKYTIRIGCRTVRTAIKPDTYLFLKRGGGEYDLLTIDTKISSARSTPETKYVMQTEYYNWVIEQVVGEELGISIVNHYVVLNKSASYRGFLGEDPIIKQTRYRTQTFTPITMFEQGSAIREQFPNIISRIVDEKNMLVNEPETIPGYREKQASRKACNKCYPNTRVICNYLHRKLGEGMDVKSVLEKTLPKHDSSS